MQRPLESVRTMNLPATELKDDLSSEEQGLSANRTSVDSSVQSAGARISPLDKKQEKRANKNLRSKSSQEKKQTAANPLPNIPLLRQSKSARVAFTLLLVRPWVLVAGLWLFSLLTSAAAIQGLIKPGSLMQALPETTVEAPKVATSSLINVVEGDLDAEGEPAVSESEAVEEAAPEVVDSEAQGGSFPVLPLIMVTGAGAAGCLVLARRRAIARVMKAKSKQVKSKPRVRRKPVRADAVRPIETVQSLKRVRKPTASVEASRQAPKANVRTAAADKELNRAQKRRQRNRRTSTAQSAPISRASATKANNRKQKPLPTRKVKQSGNNQNSSHTQMSRNKTQRSSPTHPARARRVRRTASRTARNQAVVSVVPASESHALDWTNGSLAHQMDVRKTASM